MLEKRTTRGGLPGVHMTPGRASPSKRTLVGGGQPGPPLVPIFWYIRSFDLEKIGRRLSGRRVTISRWNLGKSTFALRRSDSAGGPSLLEGEMIVIINTNNSPILGREISINIFNNTISSQTLVHLLCSTLLPVL